jgi:phosphoribosyl-ATP pyrophosphohydrolase/phosphoribosyl-AMP cyclohydrolase
MTNALRGTVDPAALVYGADGLVPVVVQDVASGAVLMLAWADRAAVERTLATGEAHFWSRSRRRPWKKGETSGHVLAVVEARADCDGDALLLRADPRGPTCHRGVRSCFDPAPEAGAAEPPPRLELGWLAEVIRERAAAGSPASYTARLLAGGPELPAQKVGEEAVETVIAALVAAREGTPEARGALTAEAADLLYHLLVLLAAAGGDPGAVAAELRARHRIRSAPAPAAGGATEEQRA